MENKDTNTDYQKVLGVGDQIWEILETAIEIFFFFFEIFFHYSLYREFWSSTWKKIMPLPLN